MGSFGRSKVGSPDGSKFRRVKGYRQLLQLLAALEEATADQPGTESLDRRVAG